MTGGARGTGKTGGIGLDGVKKIEVDVGRRNGAEQRGGNA